MNHLLTRGLTALACMLGLCQPAGAQQDKSLPGAFADSLRVERWLAEASFLPEASCRTLHFARLFLGTPYVAGTLDGDGEEQLVTRTDAVDCMTLVENVVALTLADAHDKRRYADFRGYVEQLRYRGGKREGYTSRLHYFTDWVVDNQHKGLVRECSRDVADALQRLSLRFMTDHVSAYPALKGHPARVEQLKRWEQSYQNLEIPYIKKSSLKASPRQLKIQNGDILAITTAIRGLDVVHMGFACWVGEELHLLHASSVKKQVILDPISIYDYCKNKKSQTGVRVVRVIGR